MSKWLGCFFLDFSSFCLPSSLVCVVPLSTIWKFASGIKTHALPGLSVSLIYESGIRIIHLFVNLILS